MIVNHSEYHLWEEEIVKQMIPSWKDDDIVIQNGNYITDYIALTWNGEPYVIEVLNNVFEEFDKAVMRFVAVLYHASRSQDDHDRDHKRGIILISQGQKA